MHTNKCKLDVFPGKRCLTFRGRFPVKLAIVHLYSFMKRTVLNHIVKQNSKIIPLHTPIAELNVYCVMHLH